VPTPPLISVVIPVYGVARYLPECLDSVLGAPGGAVTESGGRIEVIAVEDTSPDDASVLLDERAATDSRLTVLHTARHLGPGGARNAGLAAAAGEYVWFVDGDDLIADGAIEAITGRLQRDRPDLLLIDYEDQLPDGRTSPSPGGALLGGAPAGVFTLADAPQLTNLTMTSWSKLFGRQFLTGLNEPFPAGIHEDIPVTCAALFAGRLSALDQVCYRYRRARQGSFMATTSADHFAVFDAYERVLDRLGKLAEDGEPVATPDVRAATFERAIWHYTTVLAARRAGPGPGRSRSLVPRGERRRFFGRMHADYLRYVPAGYQPPPGARGAKFRLIRRNAYLVYELLEPLNRIRVRLRGLLRG
jgi:CDP-glycerol glycerophosphotransferase